jgi:hypothetical protein
MSVDQAGVHAGPGMTGTPFAYASYDAAGTKLTGTTNIDCSWTGSRYDCYLFQDGTATEYSPSTHLVTVTPQSAMSPRIAVVNTIPSMPPSIAVRVFDTSWTSIQHGFSIVVYKP